MNKGWFKKGRISNRKGVHLSEETKRKISINNGARGKPAWNRGLKNLVRSFLNKIDNPSKRPEIKLKLSISHKGHKHSEKTKEKMRLSARNSLNKGRFKKGQFGLDKHPNWKGGKSFELYGFDFTKELKTKIRKRDKFTCKICKKNGFDVHHIDYNKKNQNENNLMILCRRCHIQTNQNRDFWQTFLPLINYNIGGHINAL